MISCARKIGCAALAYFVGGQQTGGCFCQTGY